METLDTVPDIRPEFRDARSCKEWLAVLPLTNIQFAHQALGEQISRLNKFDLPPLERFKILETLRETVAFLQTENSKKYLQKPAPLNAVEHAAWQKACLLWGALTRGYELCLEAGNALLAANASTLCHRCLRYTGLQMLEYVHANQQCGATLWKRLHHFYRIAENNAFAAEAVKDPLHKNDDQISCNTAYVHALLLNHANPFDLTAKQIEQTDRWLGHWSYKVRISAEQPVDPAVAPLALDLDGAEGLCSAANISATESVRYLSMEKICSSLRKRVKFLRAGGSPDQLDLGDDCIQPACEALLVYLHQQWCESVTQRTYQRRTRAELAQVCFGISATHYFLSGKPFDQPRLAAKLTQQEAQQIAVFGRVTSSVAQNSPISFAIESWQIVDESATGFRLAREATAGGRISGKQLLALQPADSAAFVVGTVRWLMIDPQAKLHVGTRLFPGCPQAAAIRSLSIHGSNEKFVQALFLPAIPELEEVATLIIPSRMYQANLQMELLTGSLQKIALKDLVERGLDYDRVTFTSG